MRRFLFRACIGVAALAAAPALARAQGRDGSLRLHFFGAGGGAAVLIAPNGESALFDGDLAGDCRRALGYLQALGLANVDYVVTSSATATHCLPAIQVGAGAQIVLDGSSAYPVSIRTTDRGTVTIRFGDFDAELAGDSDQWPSHSAEAVGAPRVEVYQARPERRFPAAVPTPYAPLPTPRVPPVTSLWSLRARVAIASVVGGGVVVEQQHGDRLRAIATTTYWTDTDPVVVEVGAGASHFALRRGDGIDTYPMWEPGPALVASHAASAAPFGVVDTPVAGATGITGAIAVTGWALDDQEVAAVRIFRSPAGSEAPGANVFVGNAVFVTGTRPDVATAFPSMPFKERAGWGYLLLTNLLPGQGNGQYTLWIYADDRDGNTTLLASRTFTGANASSTKPFGTIDTPAQGEAITGSSYINFGWALTPQPNLVPVDGSTIDVYVDNVLVGHPVYNNFRADIATLFPGLNNTNGAIGYFVLNTSSLANGTHTIFWIVRDNAGNSEGIGSRYFSFCASPFSITPSSRSHGPGAETGFVTVTTGAGCVWSTSSSVPWITISAGTTGAGGGTVSYAVAANPSTSARTGTLNVAGQTFTVTQAGVICTASISPSSRSHGAAADAGTVNVTVATGCAWTASSNASWLSITSGSAGSGDGIVSYTVAANPDSSTRTGTLTIAGQTFAVTQAGVSCSPVVSPTSRSHGAGAETGTVSVVAPTGCTWTSVSQASWITITAGNSGSGNGGVSYIISANADANSRTGTVAIAGQIFTVTQAGSSCTPAISPTTRNHGSGSETGTVTVTAGSGCSWTAVSNVTWITITAGSGGTANGSVSYSVAANADATARTGTATIAGQVFTVTQAGAPCTPSISPTSRSHGAAASTGNTVAVTAGSGCAWTAASNASWLTITAGSSGTGDGTVTYSVAANTGGARTGTMTIAGQTFTVTQSAGTSGVTITITRAGVSPKSLTVPLGTQVTFVNNDVIAHDMTSDPHPEHTDCPELNQVGFLQPGQSRQTGNLVTPRTCGFHDHDLPFNTSLQGSIVIQATRAPAASSK